MEYLSRFPLALNGITSDWYNNLPPDQTSNWEMLQYYFLLEFQKHQKEVGNPLLAQDQVVSEPTPLVHLKKVKQWIKENVKKYSTRVIGILSSHDHLPPTNEVIAWYIAGLYEEI